MHHHDFSNLNTPLDNLMRLRVVVACQPCNATGTPSPGIPSYGDANSYTRPRQVRLSERIPSTTLNDTNSSLLHLLPIIPENLFHRVRNRSFTHTRSKHFGGPLTDSVIHIW